MTEAKYAGKVGYVGLGNMGAGIATRLARVGMDLVVFDLRKEAVEELVAEGASGAGSLAELAAACDTVLVCVEPSAAVLDVLKGMVEYLHPGQTVFVQSSISPQMVVEAAELAAASGSRLYDAPVSGSMADRLNGTLSVLVGASEETVGAERALLEIIGRPLYFDALGGGEVAKLANNAIMTVTRRAVSEAMAFAGAYGLSEDEVRKVVAISSGQSFVTENWEYFNEQHRNGVVLRLGPKQAREIIDTAEAKGLRMRMLEAVREHGLEIDTERYRLLTGKDPERHLS
jgi:3-hydroxyisobutyrate dehydrogenase